MNPVLQHFLIDVVSNKEDSKLILNFSFKKTLQISLGSFWFQNQKKIFLLIRLVFPKMVEKFKFVPCPDFKNK